MGFFDSAPHAAILTWVAPGTATTANTNIAFPLVTLDVPPSGTYVFHLNITAQSGTSPTFAVQLQESLDGTNWANVGSPIVTGTPAVGLTRAVIGTAVAPQLRLQVTVGGTTPSITWGCKVAIVRSVS